MFVLGEMRWPAREHSAPGVKPPNRHNPLPHAAMDILVSDNRHPFLIAKILPTLYYHDSWWWFKPDAHKPSESGIWC
jgi:hypothetical protein